MAPTAPGKDGALQKVSREHHIGDGPGGTVVVAGGKYTTSRKMGEEIVDFALKSWKSRFQRETRDPMQSRFIGRSDTKKPVNPFATPAAMAQDAKSRAPRAR